MKAHNFERMAIGCLAILFVLFINITAHSQEKSLSVKYVESNEFTIDGVLDEAEWGQASTTSGFWEKYPTDKKAASFQTEIKMLYNDEYLYVGIVAHSKNGDFVVPSLERDFSDNSDYINLMFGTYGDRNNAFLFGTNPYGVQKEGLISEGGIGGNLDLSWDVKWLTEVTRHKDKYIVELKIPMVAFKFKKNTQQWKFNCSRRNIEANTETVWSKVPRVYNLNDIGYYGVMNFEKPLEGESKNQISLIPYTTGAVYSNPSENEDAKFDGKVGVDAKLPIGKSFMMDLTINPDYSSTDLAAGENNITRFELKKPEKRQFFIDNADLFNGFGFGSAQAFYSRRIGIGNDTLGNTVTLPVLGGAKFSGKVNKDLRVGILNIQTKKDEEKLIANNNNFVAAAEQKVFSKSTIGFIFVNRQVTNSDFEYSGTKYNRVAGTDFNFYSKDNSVSALGYVHRSFTPDASGSQISSGAEGKINKRKYEARLTSQFIDDEFQSDIGYTERKDFFKINPFVEARFYPEKINFLDRIGANLNQIGVNVYYNSFWKPSDNMRNIDWSVTSESKWFFTEGNYFATIAALRYVYLESPFDPTNTPGAVPLPIGGYKYDDYIILYNTDRRKDLAFNTSLNFGEFYSGYRTGVFVDARYRIQPFLILGMIIQNDNINLPEPHPSSNLWYVEPVVIATFNKNITWTSQVQYSNQSKTMYVNSRLQWRYAPLSDIFLTYTDSYITEPSMVSTNRGLYLKLTYWLDL